MALTKSKFSKITIALLMMSLFCFMFAGTAMASFDNVLTVDVNGNPYAYTGCDNNYTFDVSNINSIQASCFNNAEGIDLYIGFRDKSGLPYVNDFVIKEDMTVPVKMLISNGTTEEWYYAQPTPEQAGNIANVYKLHIPNLQIADTNGYFVKQIVIGDDLQNLLVKNECKAGTYCVDLFLDTACVAKVFTTELTVKSAPARIDAEVKCENCPNSKIVACGDCVTVTGKVWDCGGRESAKGVPAWPVDVTIGGLTKTVNTEIDGTYRVSFSKADGLKLVPGTMEALVSAANPCDPGAPVTTKVEFYVEKNFAKSVSLSVKDWDKVDGQLRYNKCNDVTISLKDDCGNPAKFDQDMWVYLSAFTPGNPPEVAGHFYLECPPLERRDSAQIGKVLLPARESSVTVQLVPLVQGTMYVEAQVDGLSSGAIAYESIAPNAISKFEITPLVTKAGSPVAGWPLAVKVMLDYSASEDYDVTFTAVDGSGAPVKGFTYDDEMVKAFGNKGTDDAIFPYCNEKWYYFLYPDLSVVGKTLTFTVDVGGLTETFTVGPFADPVEMQRDFKADAWQTFSVPKYVASVGNEASDYATFAEVLPFEPIVIKYNNDGNFKGWVWVKEDEEIDPLKGYYVKTPQIEEWEGAKKQTVDFVFARAIHPGQQYPPMDQNPGYGWNTVGVAVSPTIEKTLERQSDTTAHAFGSLLEKSNSYNIWNPGSALGNVNDKFTAISLSGQAFPSYTVDAMKPVFNGDVYWIYGAQGEGPNQDQPYTANIGLDIFEWDGDNDQPQ